MTFHPYPTHSVLTVKLSEKKNDVKNLTAFVLAGRLRVNSQVFPLFGRGMTRGMRRLHVLIRLLGWSACTYTVDLSSQY